MVIDCKVFYPIPEVDSRTPNDAMIEEKKELGSIHVIKVAKKCDCPRNLLKAYLWKERK